MARRSLKPQLNQIRAWVRQGRTDAWIAHQLEISASELREFRKQHDLTPDGEDGGGEVDLRDEIEAEVEAATAEEEAEEELQEEEGDEGDGEDAEGEDEGDEEKPAQPARKARKPDEDDDEDGTPKPRRRRRRGRRGGRGRRKEIEATFDHGERDGYGLWLDAAVKDNPVYAEHWAGKREVTVRIDADQIVIRRAGEPAAGDSDSE
ncbi:MAG TPA: hypothetical protein VFI09_09555 [Solirubrobacterales bacterium]|nr:hypothetical protein [Solirubrobacterales bacterium]